MGEKFDNNIEIERKFLVRSSEWRKGVPGILFLQGYLSTHKERTVRVRTMGDQAFLAIKGLTEGSIRPEYEYEIPLDHASEILNNLCEKPLIEKTRYNISYKDRVWEVDEFHGINEGLIVAEIELDTENEQFECPGWIGEEVTDDPRYFNSNLVANPFTTWQR